MNIQPLLVLDAHYLAYRAFYTTGGLAHGGKSTGVIFGFLKTISILKEEFQTDRIAFCFEHPHLLRRDIFPEYKLKRRYEKSEQEINMLRDLHEQIKLLQKEHLPRIGFKNIFSYDGYESDDIMAAIAADTPDNQECILVTSDADLLQCLDDNVSIYSPQARKLWTKESFIKKYGIRPSRWAVVKAIAGCKSDCIPGVKGIGETTALKYVSRTLKETCSAYKKITDLAGVERILRNRWLVELPYVNCPSPIIQEDKVNLNGWKSVCADLGFKSLSGMPPVHVRSQSRLKI